MSGSVAHNVDQVLTIFLRPVGYPEPKLAGSKVQDVSNEWKGLGTGRVMYALRLFLSRPDVEAVGHNNANQEGVHNGIWKADRGGSFSNK